MSTTRGKVIAVLTFCVVAVLLTSQRGGIVKICPDTLEITEQRERTIFMTRIPIFRTFGTSDENELIEFLVKEGYLARTPAGMPQRWVTLARWSGSHEGAAGLYPVFFDHSEAVLEWTQENPKCAKLVWGETIRLLRSQDQREVVAGKAVLDACWGVEDTAEAQRRIDRIKEALPKE